MSSVITWNKKHSSKRVIPVTDTLDKRFFVAALFEGLWVFFSDRLKELYHILVCMSLYFCISREKKTK